MFSAGGVLHVLIIVGQATDVGFFLPRVYCCCCFFFFTFFSLPSWPYVKSQIIIIIIKNTHTHTLKKNETIFWANGSACQTNKMVLHGFTVTVLAISQMYGTYWASCFGPYFITALGLLGTLFMYPVVRALCYKLSHHIFIMNRCHVLGFICDLVCLIFPILEDGSKWPEYGWLGR